MRCHSKYNLHQSAFILLYWHFQYILLFMQDLYVFCPFLLHFVLPKTHIWIVQKTIFYAHLFMLHKQTLTLYLVKQRKMEAA